MTIINAQGCHWPRIYRFPECDLARRPDLVDESHRLNQRANQASAAQNTKFRTITEKLFGHDDTSKTQLDWIRTKSTHQILFLDAAQSVRPADLPTYVARYIPAAG